MVQWFLSESVTIVNLSTLWFVNDGTQCQPNKMNKSQWLVNLQEPQNVDESQVMTKSMVQLDGKVITTATTKMVTTGQ